MHLRTVRSDFFFIQKVQLEKGLRIYAMHAAAVPTTLARRKVWLPHTAAPHLDRSFGHCSSSGQLKHCVGWTSARTVPAERARLGDLDAYTTSHACKLLHPTKIGGIRG
jgi:hypothetical protein